MAFFAGRRHCQTYKQRPSVVIKENFDGRLPMLEGGQSE